MQTLPRNLEDNPRARFVLLNYNSGDGLLDYVLTQHQTDLQSGRLVMYSTFEPERFNMAHAKNLAHRLGILEGADVLVNLDADNFTGPGFDDWLVDEFQGATGERFLYSTMIKHGPDRLDRGITGRIAVTRNAFMMAGGYDEKYADWGSDDEDFKTRLRMLGIPSGEIPSRFLKAIRHTDKLRFREYRHVERNAYDKPPVCPDSAVANYGRVGLGKVFRNESGRLISIDAIATRVFGIGMHKTGTSSLHAAFNLLGLNSAHWNTALWARAVYQETMAGRSATVEHHYAFSDLPFPLLYKELDKAYPGSKFILTVRDESAWLRSVRDHWDPEVNPYRRDWDIAPFTHKVHNLLYGRKTFDADVFLERYRRHNAEVMEYFHDRPGDLLVMTTENLNWGALCWFLDRPHPAVPFPHQLRTSAYEMVLNYEI